MSTSVTDRLPYELNMAIINLVLFSHTSPNDYREFYRLRTKLLATYRGWFTLIMDEPTLWSYILLTLKTSPTTAPTYIRRSANKPLHFRLAFGRCFTTTEYEHGSPTIVKEIDNLLNPLKPFFERALHIHIECGHHHAMERVRKHLGRTYVPLLKRLTIRRTYNAWWWAEDLDDVVQTRTWFGGKMAALDELYLDETNMPFQRMDLPALTYLHISGVLDTIQMEARSIETLIKRCTLLRELNLAETSISGSAHAGEIRSTSITTLGIIFSTDGSLANMARILDLPNLKTITLHLRHDLDMEEATSCSKTFEQATTMHIIAGTPDDANIMFTSVQLFEHTARIETLDLSEARGNLFRLLLNMSEKTMVNGNTTILPRLRNINLPLITSASLKRFVMIHDRLAKMNARTSDHYGPVTEKKQANREWIAERIHEFTLQSITGGTYQVTTGGYVKLLETNNLKAFRGPPRRLASAIDILGPL
ncbi:hypothetical protein B0H11DRAFT_1912179 [Mycena galericulata]|nr:hypothetical protein B0H11DRAFT_1912179 [Mycena galericulata]